MTFFDLPTNSQRARKAYQIFRKRLLQDGFSMLQYSVYIRHCASRENAEVHIRRVKRALPNRGNVSILMVTDKQFSQIIHFQGRTEVEGPSVSQQMEMF